MESVCVSLRRIAVVESLITFLLVSRALAHLAVDTNRPIIEIGVMVTSLCRGNIEKATLEREAFKWQ